MSMMQNGIVCYNYNNFGHLAKKFKSSKENTMGLETIVDSRGKGKLLWVNKSKENVEGGSTSTMDAVPSFSN